MSETFLNGKVILILSPQSWGKMLLAKHHYAMELASLGNEVYFLNPPDNHHWQIGGTSKRIKISPVSGYPNLSVIDQQLFFPYNLKFHVRPLFDKLIKKQLNDILSQIPKKIDIIWSFDLGNLIPFSLFDKKIFKVFHPVDEPADENALRAGAGADILFSVTHEIIDKYKSHEVPSYFINHGLAEEFMQPSLKGVLPHEQIQVGLSGNFLRPDLDRKILLQILHENPEILFNFFGSYHIAQSNIGATEDHSTAEFIKRLQSQENVRLHGVVNTLELAHGLNQMDALFICYDMQLDQSKGTNYHKVMEYLSTGKVIISNNITTYQSYPEMIRMTKSRTNNDQLPELFRETLADLSYWNAEHLMNARRCFAGDNSYRHQIKRIDQYILPIVNA